MSRAQQCAMRWIELLGGVGQRRKLKKLGEGLPSNWLDAAVINLSKVAVIVFYVGQDNCLDLTKQIERDLLIKHENLL